MKNKVFYENFFVGEIVFCSKFPACGIHQVSEVQNRGNGTNPLILSEFLFTSDFKKVKASKRNREFMIDASFFKKIDWKQLSVFLQERSSQEKECFEKMMICLRKNYRHI